MALAKIKVLVADMIADKDLNIDHSDTTPWLTDLLKVSRRTRPLRLYLQI
jgi:hypothetical protein